MRSPLVCLVACALLIPASMSAQRLDPRPVSFRASESFGVSNAPELVPRGNHGTEGTLIGAVALGAFGLWLSGKVCEIRTVPASSGYSSCTVGTKVVFTGAVALAGAGLGYLIGSGYPKYVEP